MTVPVMNYLVTLMLAKFMLNDVPHMLDGEKRRMATHGRSRRAGVGRPVAYPGRIIRR